MVPILHAKQSSIGTVGIDSFRIGTIGRLFPEDFDALVNSIREVLSDMGVTPIGAKAKTFS